MILHVPLEDFPTTVQRVLGIKEVFLELQTEGTLATSASEKGDRLVAAMTQLTLEEAAAVLKKAGMTVFNGRWGAEIEFKRLPGEASHVFIGAVAYATQERPGLWIDVYPEPPSQLQILRAMFEEFCETGEISGVGFEEFVRIANPNVVIMSPERIRSTLGDKNRALSQSASAGLARNRYLELSQRLWCRSCA